MFCFWRFLAGCTLLAVGLFWQLFPHGQSTTQHPCDGSKCSFYLRSLKINLETLLLKYLKLKSFDFIFQSLLKSVCYPVLRSYNIIIYSTNSLFLKGISVQEKLFAAGKKHVWQRLWLFEEEHWTISEIIKILLQEEEKKPQSKKFR